MGLCDLLCGGKKSRAVTAAKETKESERTKETKEISRAKSIVKNYDQLGKCRTLISEISQEDGDGLGYLYGSHTGGWKISKYSIEAAGIDMRDVYEHIKIIATKKKAELECELAKTGE